MWDVFDVWLVWLFGALGLLLCARVVGGVFWLFGLGLVCCV